MFTIAEENYLKALYKISQHQGAPVSTNSLAEELVTSAASVTDMLKKLSEKELIQYQRYQGAQLTQSGSKLATDLVRRHRLWECFLVDKLGYKWDEVHDLAEQLEHIKSEDLVDRLEEYLDHPRFDPHGDPIPDKQGRFTLRTQIPLLSLKVYDKAEVVGVAMHDSQFLRFLDDLDIQMGSQLQVLELFEFDSSMRIIIDQQTPILISPIVSKNVLVKKL